MTVVVNVRMGYIHMTHKIILVKLYELLQCHALQHVAQYCIVENNVELHYVLW